MVLNQMSTRSLKQDLTDELRLNVAYDLIPTTVRSDIQPVVEVKKKWCNIVRSNSASASTASNLTIYTTPADKDFYLVAAVVSIAKNAACDTASGGTSLSATVEGTAQPIVTIRSLTLNAQFVTQTLQLPIPIKVDRNTNIILSGSTFGAGEFARGANIIGYILEGNAGS